MKTRKSLLLGTIALLFIGFALVLLVSSRKTKKIVPDTSKNKISHSSDSVTQAGDEALSLEMGVIPEIDSKDGSVKIVEDFIKSNAKNPGTFEFFEWSRVSSEGGYWKVRCKYRGTSSFNVEVTTNAWFYIQKNKVVHTKIISKI